MVTNYEYEGAELEIFQHAVCWKSYLAAQIGPHLRGDVLEVGAGIGANTRIFCHAGVVSWTALEPDAKLAESMRMAFGQEPPPVPSEVFVGALDDLAAEQRFDTILYVDVLEHIEDDGQEVRRAMDRLRADGTLIVLSPAHQWLFTEFDRAIGHYRRYSARSLREIIPKGLARAEIGLPRLGRHAGLGGQSLSAQVGTALAGADSPLGLGHGPFLTALGSVHVPPDWKVDSRDMGEKQWLVDSGEGILHTNN